MNSGQQTDIYLYPKLTLINAAKIWLMFFVTCGVLTGSVWFIHLASTLAISKLAEFNSESEAILLSFFNGFIFLVYIYVQILAIKVVLNHYFKKRREQQNIRFKEGDFVEINRGVYAGLSGVIQYVGNETQEVRLILKRDDSGELVEVGREEINYVKS